MTAGHAELLKLDLPSPGPRLGYVALQGGVRHVVDDHAQPVGQGVQVPPLQLKYNKFAANYNKAALMMIIEFN